MIVHLRAIAVAAAVLAAACAPRDAERAAVDDAEADTAAVIDEHAGHEMETPPPDDPHVGHGPPVAAEHPHAEHAAPTTAADPHAAHRAEGPARAGVPDAHAAHAPAAGRSVDPHAGHTPAAPPRAVEAPLAADGAHDKLMLLVRSLLVEPAVQRRIDADSALRRLWNDQSVREHILSDSHHP